jgi:2-keto-3-deoxy-L-rhamnonate aldolase RhmA
MTRLDRAIANRERGRGPLLGVATYFYDPIFLEMAGKLGFDVAWIEMEHAFITFAEAADLCRIAAGAGMLTMIRVPDTRRDSVLKAAECGPDIIDLPMAEDPATLHELLSAARYQPEGKRGTFSVSRALAYGLSGDLDTAQRAINNELCLMAQIETREAVERADELCAVPGVDIFIGPGDLAVSLGVPGRTDHPTVKAAAALAVKAAKKYGKRVAAASGAADFGFWVEQGVDLLFCTNDIVCLRSGVMQAMEQAKAAIGSTAQPSSSTSTSKADQ